MVTDRSLCGSESETLRKPSAALVLGGQSARGDARLLKMPKHREMQQQELVGALGKRRYFKTLFLVFGIRFTTSLVAVAADSPEC